MELIVPCALFFIFFIISSIITIGVPAYIIIRIIKGLSNNATSPISINVKADPLSSLDFSSLDAVTTKNLKALLQYMVSAYSSGQNKQEIENALLAKGWIASEINLAFKYYAQLKEKQ